MKAIAMISLCLALPCAAARADDVVKVAPDSNRVLVENDHVRVVEGRIRPGAREGLHTHAAGWYYVSQAGTLQVRFADGREETWSPKAGESGWAEAEGPHTSVNTGKTTLVWTLVEVKSAAK